MSDISKQIGDSLNRLIAAKIEEYANTKLDKSLREKISDQAFTILETMDFSSRITRRYFKAFIESKINEPWVSELVMKNVQHVLDYRLLQHIEKRVEANLGDDEIDSTILGYVNSGVEEHLASDEIDKLIESTLIESILAKLQSQNFIEKIDKMIDERIKLYLIKIHESFLNPFDNPADEQLGGGEAEGDRGGRRT